MNNKRLLKTLALILTVSACAVFVLAGMRSGETEESAEPDLVASATRSVGGTGGSVSGAGSSSGSPLLDGEELFSSRDLEQSPDLSGAVCVTVSDGQTITISQEGVYLLQGTAQNCTVIVDADETAKVQLVLDGLSVENANFPCIYVKSADKVFITTVSDSSLSVTGSFVSDGSTNTDAVIFSKEDLVLNGTASLYITSGENGVSCKDDLKITGGSYWISAASKCLEANDSIRIADGSFSLSADSDCLHAENDEDDSLGYIYIGGGSFTLSAGDDGIHAKAFVQIDGGSFVISAAEGIEATTVQLNGGSISIQSWDDGINAARKSNSYAVCVEVNGGEISIAMGAGDTDGIDSNGSIVINGGVIRITGNSSFDYDGTGQLNGGTVYVNGQQVTTLPNQVGGMGGFGGQMGGMGGFGGRGRRG